jgi:organic radical activating enzyme
MSKPTFQFLETMASYSCNLSCQGCTNYSDLNLKGFVKWKECESWLKQWLELVNIEDFSIIGGEPLINPEIKDWLIGCRTLMPNSKILLVTNGLLLQKKFDIIDLMNSIGNCVLKISVHVDDQNLNDTIDTIFKKYKFEPIVEHGVLRYQNENKFKIQVKKPDIFIKTFKNDYKDMIPHRSNPVKHLKFVVKKIVHCCTKEKFINVAV